jgi:transposase
MVKVPQRRGRPRTRPKELVADKAYDSQAFRRSSRRRGIKSTMRPVARGGQGPKRGRPLQAGSRHRQRWHVERCFGWMDHCRRLVVRDERTVEHDPACCLMAIILWCVNLILT